MAEAAAPSSPRELPTAIVYDEPSATMIPVRDIRNRRCATWPS